MNMESKDSAIGYMRAEGELNEPNPDGNNSVEETKEEGIVFLGIHMKKKATRCNLFSIFYVFFLMTTIGGYINVQIVYLLRDHGYFDID